MLENDINISILLDHLEHRASNLVFMLIAALKEERFMLQLCISHLTKVLCQKWDTVHSGNFKFI